MRVTAGRYDDQVSFGICFIWSWDWSLVLDIGPFWIQLSVNKGE